MDLHRSARARAFCPRWRGMSMGFATSKAVGAIARQPERPIKSTQRYAGPALMESTAIYGFRSR